MAPRAPEVSFLALSVSDAAEDVISLIRAGARGYVTKTISGPELADAIRRVADGDAVFSPRLAGFVLDAFAAAPPPGDTEVDQLTSREQEVLRLIARGLSDRQVGEQLGLSGRTVGTHVRHMLAKTGLDNRTELSVWAVEQGLVER